MAGATYRTIALNMSVLTWSAGSAAGKGAEQKLQKEAEEALLLHQYLRRKQASELLEEREAKR